MDQVKQWSQMGSSTLNPDGGVSISCQHIEGMIKAFQFWFPDVEAPDFLKVTVSEAPNGLIEFYLKSGQIPPSQAGKTFWQISVPMAPDEDGVFGYEVEFCAGTRPTRDEALWIAWSKHYEVDQNFG